MDTSEKSLISDSTISATPTPLISNNPQQKEGCVRKCTSFLRGMNEFHFRRILAFPDGEGARRADRVDYLAAELRFCGSPSAYHLPSKLINWLNARIYPIKKDRGKMMAHFATALILCFQANRLSGNSTIPVRRFSCAGFPFLLP